MAEFRIVFDGTSQRRLILLPVEVESLQEPIQMYRDEDQQLRLDDAEENLVENATVAPLGGIEVKNQRITRRHAQILNPDDEQDFNNKIKEQYPWTIEDYEQRAFVGRLKNLNKGNFVLFMKKDEIRMIPLEKTYDFKPKVNYVTVENDEEEKEKSISVRASMDKWIASKRVQKTKREEKKEVVAEEKEYECFDDDDNEGEIISEEPSKKKLSPKGKELAKFLKKFDDRGDVSSSEGQEEVPKRKIEEVPMKRVRSTSPLIQKEDIVMALKKGPMKTRDFVALFRAQREANPENREVMRMYVKFLCEMVVVPGSTEKYIKLKETEKK